MRFWQAMGRLLMATVLTGLGGCAAFYVDGHMPEVPTAQYRKPTSPAEVQLVWEFQTKGVANARATELLKSRVREQLAASGLFGGVTESPVVGGALLTLTVNNVPLNDDAFAKGFLTGLTFGLAGQTVGDGYDGVLRYVPSRDRTTALERRGKHVIYTSLGTGGPPPGAVKTTSVDEAVTIMLRQLISRLLNDLSIDPAFP